MNLQRFRLVRDQGYAFPSLPDTDSANVQSAISRALHQERAPANARVDSLWQSRGNYFGTAPPSCSVEMLSTFRDSIIRVARSADPAISGLELATQPGNGRVFMAS